MRGVDSSLFPLFAMEAENQCGELSSGMLKIEQQPDDLDTFDAMMRAAHAMKGAARVVGLDCAVALAHSMEDYFTAASQANIQVASGDIDVLLGGLDVLQAMAKVDVQGIELWLGEHAEKVERFAADIALLSQGKAIEKQTIAASDKVEDELMTASQSVLPEPAQNQSQHQTDSHDIRLTRQSMDVMMGLAGEAQLANRQMEPVRKQLQTVRNILHESDMLVGEMQKAVADVFAGDGHAYHQQRRRMKRMQESINVCFRMVSDQCMELNLQQRQSASISGRLYDHMVESRMQPFAGILPGLKRMTRDIARDLGKQVKLKILGEDTLVDRDIADRMQAPLQHLIRNAIDHGIENQDQRLAAGKLEQAEITLEARHQGGMLMLTVSDNGVGINIERLRQRIVSKGMSTEELTAAMSQDEILEFLFLPRFSMRDVVSEVSGRGAGLDLVASTIRKLRGRIVVKNNPGQSMSFAIRLPLTLSVLPAMIVEIRSQLYAIPLARIVRVEHCKSSHIKIAEGRQYMQYRGQHIGLLQATQVFGIDDAPAQENHEVVILGEQQQYGFVVDRIVGEDNILEKPLDSRFGKIENVSAGSVMQDGRVALILDVDDLLHEMQQLVSSGRVRSVEHKQVLNQQSKRVLVVDDSITVREAERRLLSNHGYQVSVAVDGMDGWNALRSETFDLLVSDIDMPRMDGIELVRMLRADSRLGQLPVIVVSYKDSEEDRMRGLEAGANAYLTKSSFHDDSFIQSVQDLIGDV
ncbi:MAG: hybrid sensor histidine kinase/response regulator [Mariprofundus sp.]|nr:hybrid sensor histidine kinase/response regulator [Mariprofundus sp.]